MQRSTGNIRPMQDGEEAKDDEMVLTGEEAEWALKFPPQHRAGAVKKLRAKLAAVPKATTVEKSEARIKAVSGSHFKQAKSHLPKSLRKGPRYEQLKKAKNARRAR